ncbi:uncharacterized protein MEPE_04444 [Melanopsichium pennsylvanicum]|uniref:Uncharacterized protein n=2 Tax=Melanopsichium pennsylvanicum TaxID=63383 RepID=A0AAJ4XNU6_9BASI|nr:putative protein [Melanopsichium pennsylvanicum 4]SNX85735.1 uncharacterized protein MEPE_04444 [Melanopsichium pennsylvanicum]
MQSPSWTSDDNISELTYDSSATAISPRYISFEQSTKGLHHQASEPCLSFAVNNNQYLLNARDQRQLLLPQQLQESSSRKVSDSALSAHNRQSSTLTSIASDHLQAFPMPIPRHNNGKMATLSKQHLDPEMEFLDSPRQREKLEAAWEDASCIDGASPRIGYSDYSTGLSKGLDENKERVEDRFEVDALRRQVEQLQMALQLQSKQRELEHQQMALAEQVQQAQQAQQARLKTQPSQVQQLRSSSYQAQEWSSPLPASLQGGVMPMNLNPALLRASLLDPAQSAAASMLVGVQSEEHYPAGSVSRSKNVCQEMHIHPTKFVQQPASYAERPHTSISTFIDRHHQSELSQSSSPSLSASQTLVEDKKIDDLNRKVEALELMIGAMTNASFAHSSHDRGIRPSIADSNILHSPTWPFMHNPTRPVTASSASVITSSTNSITTPTTKKGNKLANMLGLNKNASSSSQDVTSAISDTKEESRVSWSRKRTEKVAVPKAKVSRGAGRGRMVIKETATIKKS